MTILGSTAYTQSLTNKYVKQITRPNQLKPPLRSDIVYLINTMIDLTDEPFRLEIPQDGLYLKGLFSGTSGIVDHKPSSTLFTSPLEGSGNFFSDNVTFQVDGLGSQVYNIEDKVGNSAFEATGVNYVNCSSLGTVKGYRQGLEINTGRFGGTPMLTLDGAWNGFRISTSNTNGLSDTPALFKAGPNLTFSGRFITDIKANLPSVGAFSDFGPSQFLDDELFQLDGADFSRGGVHDSGDLTILPNIDHSSVKSKFKNCVGIKNTHKYLKSIVAVSVTTSVPQPSSTLVLEGIFLPKSESHITGGGDGVIEFLTGTSDYHVSTKLVIESKQGNPITVQLTLSKDGGLTYPTVVDSVSRTINSLQGGRDVSDFEIDTLYEFTKGDKIRLEVVTPIDTSNITMEENSSIIVTQA